jgi:transmembrane sensor
MSKETSRAELGSQTLEEASGWFIEFNEADLDHDERVEFNHWIRRSPENVRAFLEIGAAWEDAAGLGKHKTSNIEALVAEAMSENNVVPISSRPSGGLFESETSPVENSKKSNPGINPEGIAHTSAVRRRFAVAASVIAAAVGVTAWIAQTRNTYSTDIGEQRFITLADGSTVELNSRSKLRIDFSARERTVTLMQGQALFHVSKDARRPFIVSSDTARVRAVGTQFDVYRQTSGTTVTVLEGRVSVGSFEESESRSGGGSNDPLRSDSAPKAPQNAAEPVVLLNAGEQVVVTANAALPAKPKAIDLATATAWTQHKLIFDETPLTEAAKEFNRYNTKRVVIDDPSLGPFHVRGTFSATNPERLAEFLRERFSVTVNETSSEIRISRAAP